ncbi:MAG TPA: AI-2E family transporter [Candidatus Methanoperedenaceae archaeon]|nr:AI-2E family transporter [Candidatus Methanoperedenaceae archaeon]
MGFPEKKRFAIIAGLIAISSALLVAYLSWAFVDIIILSLLGAYLLHPLEKRLRTLTGIRDRRITAVLTMGIVVLVFFVIFLNILYVLGSELSLLGGTAQADYEGLIRYVMSLLQNHVPAQVQEMVRERLAGSAEVAVMFMIGIARDIVMGFISGIGFFMMGFFVIVFLVYYLLMDGENIYGTFMGLVPESTAGIVQEVMQHLDIIYACFFRVYLLVAIITGIIGAAGLSLIGVKYPVMWGSVIAILSILPVVGPGTFYVPAAAYYFLTGDPIRGAALLGFGWLFLEMVPGNFIRPRLMAQMGSIHPIITLLAFTAPLFAVGPMGIIIGPAAFGFLLALYRTYTGQRRFGEANEAGSP